MQLVSLTPAASSIIRVCVDSGARPLVVGGAVRDAVLATDAGAAPSGKDVDIEVHDVVDRAGLVAALAELGPTKQRGVAYPIISVVIDGEDFDIDLAQEDPFARRDFTINAMGWDPVTGELIDPFGGRRDLAGGVLRHTSDRFADDPLRVLRGVQFAGRFGFRFAAETKGACRELAPRFGEIAPARVWHEWRKLARRAEHWPEALAALEDSGWGRHFPELAATRGIEQDPGWHAEGDVYTHLGLAARAAALASTDLDDGDREVVVLAALLHDLGKVTHTDTSGSRITSYGHAEAGVEPARSLLRRIGAPDAVISRVLPIIREHMAPASIEGMPSRPAVRRLIRRLAPASFDDWARVVDADSAGRGLSSKQSPTPAWRAVASTIRPSSQRSLLRGEHLIALGYTPGREFAGILAAAVAAQDDETFTDEAGALEWFAAYAKGRPA